MKKLLLLITMCVTSFTQAQNVDFTLEWNNTASRYEFFVTRDIDAVAPLTNQSVSSVSFAYPTNPAVTNITRINENMAVFGMGTRFINPGSVGNDFINYKNTTGGSMISVLNADVKTLWMSFTTNVGCIDGMRLYINGTDPNSAAPGMSGVDITQTFNTITITGGNDEYQGNTGGNPTCTVLGVEEEATIGYSMYPNPVKDELTFTFTEQQKNATVNVYSVTGQVVYTNTPEVINNKITVNLGALSTGVYLAKVTTNLGSNTKRVVIQ